MASFRTPAILNKVAKLVNTKIACKSEAECLKLKDEFNSVKQECHDTIAVKHTDLGIPLDEKGNPVDTYCDKLNEKMKRLDTFIDYKLYNMISGGKKRNKNSKTKKSKKNNKSKKRRITKKKSKRCKSKK
jgi:hypothetical protein